MPVKCERFSLEANHNQKIYLTIRAITAFESIFFIFFENINSIPALILGLTNLSAIILYIYHPKKKETWASAEIILYIILFISAIELPIFFIASSRIAAKRELTDELLLKLDTFLLGNFFPKGQLSLYLDEHEIFGPHSILGKIINNVLLFIYFLYYLIPYVFAFTFLLKDCIEETIYRYYNNGEKSIYYNNSWSNYYFCLSVFNLTYFQILMINVLVPAVSPRLYLKYEYKNDLIFYGLTKYLSNIKDDNSANSFPSGHVGETFSLFLPFFFIKKYYISTIILVYSLLISLATVVLRYHYFVDVLMAMSNSILSFFIVYLCNCAIKGKDENKEYENIPSYDIELIDEKSTENIKFV
jgi:membrane-associated phospholipid phosphatase